jgi:single-strand DNA-binding protein
VDEAFTTLVGWVAAKPYYTVTKNGYAFLSLRAGMTPRRFNSETGSWEDAQASFVAVSCWRSLAENINASEFTIGTPIIVQGKLRVREYVHQGERRFTVELEAVSLGPDLNRGKVLFQRVSKGPATVEDREEVAGIAEMVAGLSAPLLPRDEEEQLVGIDDLAESEPEENDEFDQRRAA